MHCSQQLQEFVPRARALAFGIFAGISFIGFLMSFGIRSPELECDDEGAEDEDNSNDENDDDDSSSPGASKPTGHS